MAEQRPKLILFARFPVAGKVKTRLIPALGAEGAAALHRRLTLRTLRTASLFCQSEGVELEIRFSGDSAHEMQHWLGDGWLCRPQCKGDLGQRMANAFADSFREGSAATVIIGSDCPTLTPTVLANAFAALRNQPVAFGPATDGGYYLIGLTRPVPELFENITWGTETVLAQSKKILKQISQPFTLLQPLDDLDRPEDLAAWRNIIAVEEADSNQISVIIPALNEAGQIARTIESVFADCPHEIIIVDGGSSDETCFIARNKSANVLLSKPGRARQMNAGAARAMGNVLLFLHADTVLPANWVCSARQILEQPDVCAGAFSFGIGEKFTGRTLVESATNFRARWRQMPYGDQTIFLRRSLFEEMGGFADLPIMEDYEFNRRLRRHGRIAISSEGAITSSRRWKRLGFISTTLINQIIIAGYHLGVPPHKLAQFYRQPTAIF